MGTIQSLLWRRRAPSRALVLCGALVAFAASSPVAWAGAPAVTGGGSGLFPPGTPFAGDLVHLSVEAPSDRDHGRFEITHHSAGGDVEAHLVGDVTCVLLASHQASLTGTITEGWLRAAPSFNPTGQTVAITIDDGGRGSADRVGLDLSFLGGPHSISPCQPVPPFIAIDRGNFIVRS